MTLSAKRKRRRVKKDETEIAESLGGRRTFNSGTGLDKGDGRLVGKWRIEVKTVFTGSSYRLTATDYAKLWTTAVRAGEAPLFVISFRDWAPASAGYRVAVILEKRTLGPPSASSTAGRSTLIRAEDVFREQVLHREIVYTGVKAATFQLRIVPYTGEDSL